VHAVLRQERPSGWRAKKKVGGGRIGRSPPKDNCGRKQQEVEMREGGLGRRKTGGKGKEPGGLLPQGLPEWGREHLIVS